jgi:OOP family OmpA-OmpF porin
LTEFTSFVAIDSKVVNATGETVTVRQPLPLPQGVPNSALPTGGSIQVLAESSSISTLRQVEFKAGRDTVAPASFPILEQVVAVMKERPELRLGVYGHSSGNEGSSAQKLRLSKQRAAAVARYLTEHGIDPSRLEVEGFGDQRPIADNATEAGRAKNRRVEFKILDLTVDVR